MKTATEYRAHLAARERALADRKENRLRMEVQHTEKLIAGICEQSRSSEAPESLHALLRQQKFALSVCRPRTNVSRKELDPLRKMAEELIIRYGLPDSAKDEVIPCMARIFLAHKKIGKVGSNHQISAGLVGNWLKSALLDIAAIKKYLQRKPKKYSQHLDTLERIRNRARKLSERLCGFIDEAPASGEREPKKFICSNLGLYGVEPGNMIRLLGVVSEADLQRFKERAQSVGKAIEIMTAPGCPTRLRPSKHYIWVSLGLHGFMPGDVLRRLGVLSEADVPWLEELAKAITEVIAVTSRQRRPRSHLVLERLIRILDYYYMQTYTSIRRYSDIRREMRRAAHYYWAGKGAGRTGTLGGDFGLLVREAVDICGMPITDQALIKEIQRVREDDNSRISALR